MSLCEKNNYYEFIFSAHNQVFGSVKILITTHSFHSLYVGHEKGFILTTAKSHTYLFLIIDLDKTNVFLKVKPYIRIFCRQK